MSRSVLPDKSGNLDPPPKNDSTTISAIALHRCTTRDSLDSNCTRQSHTPCGATASATTAFSVKFATRNCKSSSSRLDTGAPCTSVGDFTNIPSRADPVASRLPELPEHPPNRTAPGPQFRRPAYRPALPAAHSMSRGIGSSSRPSAPPPRSQFCCQPSDLC